MARECERHSCRLPKGSAHRELRTGSQSRTSLPSGYFLFGPRRLHADWEKILVVLERRRWLRRCWFVISCGAAITKAWRKTAACPGSIGLPDVGSVLGLIALAGRRNLQCKE